MAGTNLQVTKPQRKVRKGTQSCWDCRRRKVRCIFAENTDSICKNCRRRGTACNSQVYPDVPTQLPSAGSIRVEAQVENQVQTRLSRIEGLIEHLVSNDVGARFSSSPVGFPTPAETEVEAGTSISNSNRDTVVHFLALLIRYFIDISKEPA
jgi:hypothetical protein